MNRFSILIIALLFVNCNGSHSFSIYHKDIQLPSGQHFKVFNFERRYTQDTPTLIILEYETDLSLDDTTQLKNQV